MMWNCGNSIFETWMEIDNNVFVISSVHNSFNHWNLKLKTALQAYCTGHNLMSGVCMILLVRLKFWYLNRTVGFIKCFHNVFFFPFFSPSNLLFSVLFTFFCIHSVSISNEHQNKKKGTNPFRVFSQIYRINSNCFVLFMTFTNSLLHPINFASFSALKSTSIRNVSTISCPVEWAFREIFLLSFSRSRSVSLWVCVDVSKSSYYFTLKSHHTLYAEVSSVSQTKLIRMEFYSPWHIYYML